MEGSRHWEPAAGLTVAPCSPLGVLASPGPTWQVAGRCLARSIWGAVVVFAGQGELREPRLARSGDPPCALGCHHRQSRGHHSRGPQHGAGSQAEAALGGGAPQDHP